MKNSFYAIAQSANLCAQAASNEFKKLPARVQATVITYFDPLLALSDGIKEGCRFDNSVGGSGRYEYELHEKHVEKAVQSAQNLAYFFDLAAKNSVDPLLVAKHCLRDFSISSSCIDWFEGDYYRSVQRAA